MNPENRARIAAHESWAKTEDKAARTSKARASLLAKFEKQVDPDGVLEPEVRAERAAKARTEHYRAIAKRPRKPRQPKATATQADHAAAAQDLRVQDQRTRAAMYRFLFDRLDEEVVLLDGLPKHQSPQRRRDEIAARRELIGQLRHDGRDEYARVLLVPYRDYPDLQVEWLLTPSPR